MRKTKNNSPGFKFSATALALMLAMGVNAAEQQADEESDEAKKDDSEVIVITGSRIKRQTYASSSPLQVIKATEAREAGLVETADILQKSSVASGQQIDLTFQGFVLDNGPGASTVSFRGLGEGRTLLMVNGRRLAPAGVEGAPTAPDLNLIPGSLVDRYELLLDGASSIYGSDAVAGVGNLILRKDFNGLEVNFVSQTPDQPNGEANTFNLAWGENFDRGFIGIGAEYQKQEPVTLDDRRWTAGCDRHVEITNTGEIRHQDLFYPNVQMQQVDPRGCKPTQSLVGRTFEGLLPGSIYYTPGTSNGGWTNFSESGQFGLPIDSDGDGVADVSFSNYTLNGRQQFAHLISEQERVSVMAYGEYTLEGDTNMTPYFEVLYSKRDSFSDAGAFQFFPDVPANNPFNLCNPNGVNGVDCGLAWDALMNNPAMISAVLGAFGCDPSSGGSCDQTVGPIGAVPTTPIVSVRGDRTLTFSTVKQTRAVFGLRGDIPALNFGDFSDWSWDTYFSYSKASGTASRPGIMEDRLNLSLSTTIEDPNNPGNYICGVDADGDGIPDGTDGCVPINMYASSLYDPLVGDFATQAERDYLFDTRDFRTDYTQTIFSAYLSGYVAELPAGSMSAVLGVEIRKDKIESIPDDVARDGLFFGFFADGGASGEKTTKEAFAEIELPLLADRVAAKELTLNLSGRRTKDEFFPSTSTWSAKLSYRPIESLLLRATQGTSYRAPNLRENFLNGQTGFNNVFDPCGIPADAINPLTGGYDPNLDNRSQEVLNNCQANGVDPTSLDFNGFNSYSVEISRGGTEDITEEDSESYTYGFAWEQPFSNEFNLTIGASYFQIDINNTIVEPGQQFIVNDCYFDLEGDSSFCNRISRDSDGRIDLIAANFINRDNQQSRGVDVNLNFDTTIDMFDVPVKWGIDIFATHTKEASETFLDDEGNRLYEDSSGEFGFPDWRGRLRLSAEWDKFAVVLTSNYIGRMAQDPLGVDEFNDIYDTNGTGRSDTCLGVAAGDVVCRDVGFADDYVTHTLSFYYSEDDWRLGAGVRNLTDEAPPEVDGSEVFAVNNTPIGVGYDLQGRTFFLDFGYRF